jgi:hypothetical protein
VVNAQVIPANYLITGGLMNKPMIKWLFIAFEADAVQVLVFATGHPTQIAKAAVRMVQGSAFSRTVQLSVSSGKPA